jgi:hypothetical protein
VAPIPTLLEMLAEAAAEAVLARQVARLRRGAGTDHATAGTEGAGEQTPQAKQTLLHGMPGTDPHMKLVRGTGPPP